MIDRKVQQTYNVVQNSLPPPPKISSGAQSSLHFVLFVEA